MATLYHGTTDYAEVETCDDLYEGHDNLLHFHTARESYEGSSYPQVFECESDFDLDAVPEVPDLRVWNPVELAEALNRQGAISDDDLARIKADASPGIRNFNPPDLLNELMDRHDRSFEYTPNVREVIQGIIEERSQDLEDDYDDDDDNNNYNGNGESARDEYIEELEESLSALDEWDDVHRRLSQTLKQRGIPAVKYMNQFEPEFKGQYSVAVLDTGRVGNPTPSPSPNAPSSPYYDTSEREDSLADVRGAIADYQTEKVDERERVGITGLDSSSMEYRGIPKQPTYSLRRGRGSMRY